jgi:chaperonin cofactor prefoldin
MIMNHKQALKQLKKMHQRPKIFILDKQALEFAIAELEDWMTGQDRDTIRNAKRTVVDKFV